MSRRVLVEQLSEARESFCGLGTRAVKIRLNKLAETDPLAKAFRIALEIEDASTQGKKYFGKWKTRCFEKKHYQILDLIEVFREQNWVFGRHETDHWPHDIIYFEIPGCEQISFHCELGPNDTPIYAGVWDRKINSTFGKLEKAITDYLGMIPF